MSAKKAYKSVKKGVKSVASKKGLAAVATGGLSVVADKLTPKIPEVETAKPAITQGNAQASVAAGEAAAAKEAANEAARRSAPDSIGYGDTLLAGNSGAAQNALQKKKTLLGS